MNGPTGNADVFMFRCIHGQPVSIGVKRGIVQNSYDLNWNPLDSLKIENVEIYNTNKECKMIQFMH